MNKYDWPFLQLIHASVLLFFFVFAFFWVLPSRRSAIAFRAAIDRVFDTAEVCFHEKYSAKQYEESTHCFDKWEKWNAANKSPEPEWNWPWAVWKEAGVTEGKDKP